MRPKLFMKHYIYPKFGLHILNMFYIISKLLFNVTTSISAYVKGNLKKKKIFINFNEVLFLVRRSKLYMQ